MVKQESPLIIAIGSTRPPKVAAVKEAFEKIRQQFLPTTPVEYLPCEVSTDINHMPLTMEELMQGAYNRVQNLIHMFKQDNPAPDFYVGLEGGFFSIEFLQSKKYFLQGWVYVCDGEKGYFAASGAMQVPEIIVKEVVAKQQELGEIIDRYGTEEDVRSKEGAFGVFSRGLITRKVSFEFAVTAAFMPFFNQSLYAQ